MPWGGNNDGTDDNTKDTLKGGSEFDTYIVDDGDIDDSDRQGSIDFNGVPISGTYTQLTNHIYQNETTGITLVVDGTRAIVQHTAGTLTTSFRIENFQDPVVGFHQDDFGIPLGGPVPLPESNTLIEGTDNAEIITSNFPNSPLVIPTSDAAESINAFGGDDTINSAGGDDYIDRWSQAA